VDLLGLVVTEEDEDALYLRAFEERLHHSLVLRRGPEPVCGHLAFRVRRDEDLDALAGHFEGLGCATSRVSGERGHGPGAALRVQDPLGFPVEFFLGMEKADCLLQRYDLHRGARIMRLDHFNLDVPDPATAYEHYRRLGFRCSEYIAAEGDGRLCAAWLFRKPTVHNVALTAGRGPRLHHVAFTTADAAAVLQTCDALAGAHMEAAIERGPGRHGVSNAFYVYLRDPDGHRVELYIGDYYTGDPDHEPIAWSSADDRRRSYWAHEVPARWYEEASPVARFDGGVAELVAPVVVE
jgi:3,4-dihydroxyphenylacetate 2,3-dioxygenase